MNCACRSILFAALLILAGLPEAAYAQSQMIADATTGHILYARNAQKKVQVASLTKIATAMVALDLAKATGRDMGEEVTISFGAAAIGGVNPVGFTAGDRATLRDMLYAALLQSDNIAAQAIADHFGRSLRAEGSESDRFVAQMNALARKLGMERTLFLNPHGIEGEGKLPYSTAADMTRLARYAMADSAFRFIVSQKERRITVTHADGTVLNYLLRNTNELLNYDAVDGVKTGMTRRAGQCVIVSAAREPEARPTERGTTVTPRRLIVTVLGSENRFGVAQALLDRGWELYDAWAAAGRPLGKDDQL